MSPTPPDEQKFTVGRDDFSFLNEEKYFFDEEELRQAKRAGLAAQLFRKGMVPDTVSNELNYYVNDAKELILTPTSEGVKVNSDNMQDARVTVNGDGTFASKAINTTKNEILVQEDEDATVGDCIKIQGTYTIRASVGLHGTISPAGYVAVDAGGTQTFTFTPDEGYAVEHVKVNGKNKGEITDYTFKKVKKDQEIEVTFREKTEQDSEPKEKRGYGPIIDWILSIIEWIKHWFQA